MVEKSDEFDEWMLNRQNFSYQNFALRNFRYCIFYGYNLLTWVCHVMSGHGILKYFCLLDKKDPPEDKDPLDNKELPDPSGSLSKVIPLSSTTSCNAEVTKVLKEAKQSVTKGCYMKLTPAQRYEIGWVSQEPFDIIKKVPRFIINRTNCEVIKNLYLEELAQKPLDADSSEFNELPYKKYGRPLNVEVDRQVQAYIKDLREASAPVNFDELKETFLQDIKHSMLMDEIPFSAKLQQWKKVRRILTNQACQNV